MATAAKIGYGSLFKSNPSGDGTTFVTVAEVFQINPPGTDIKEVEATSLDAVSSAREFLPGLFNYGEVDFDANYVKTAYTALVGYYGATKKWQVLLTDGTTITFSGFIKKLGGPEVKLEDRVTFKCVIKVTGATTVA